MKTANMIAVAPGQSAPVWLRALAVVVVGASFISFGMLSDRPDAVPQAAFAVGLTLVAVSAVFLIGEYVRHRARIISNEHFEAFIENDAAPSFVSDGDGVISSRNAAAYQRFEPTASETVAGTLRSVFANPSAVLYRLQRKAEREGAAREDIVTRSGHVRIAVHRMKENGFLWRLEDMPPRTYTIGGDNLPLPMITVGRQGAVLFMNAAARAICGQRMRTLDQIFSVLPIRTGQINFIKNDKEPISVVVMERTTTGGRHEIFLMPCDETPGLSEHKVFETLPVPLIRLAEDGEILQANALAILMLGQSDSIGKNLSDTMQGLGRPIKHWLEDALNNQSGSQAEVLQLSQRDSDAFVQVNLRKCIEDGETSLVGVLNDATELKTLEAQFVQSQKMQAIGQLAGGIAHDFNNLLTAISGHCDLLLLRHDQGDPDFGDLIQINQNANRAAALVNQLLAFSRKQNLQPETLDLRDTLADLTYLLNRLVGEKVVLTLSHDPVLKAVRADKRQLEQVFMNLVVNARDAMPDGGEIRIETESVHLKETLSRDRATIDPGEYVTVKVRDQGGGIPQDKLQKVFEPFYTTKRTGEGTGLGLSTAYGIIKQSDGYIFVDSTVGSGTEFILYFPAVENVEPAAPKPKPAQHILRAKTDDAVVLLVEDEEPVRAFASRALRLSGYTVIEAASAEDALDALTDKSLSVDIFVTDVVMPGLDGPTWVRKALKDRPQARVVFVSGYAEGAFGETDTKIPNSVFLPKPFSLKQLTQTFQEQLH